MAIEVAKANQVEKSTGWLQVSAEWLAGLWTAEFSGQLKVEGTNVLIGIRHPSIRPGDVMMGTLAHAIIPTGLQPVLK